MCTYSGTTSSSKILVLSCGRTAVVESTQALPVLPAVMLEVVLEYHMEGRPSEVANGLLIAVHQTQFGHCGLGL